MDWNPIGSPSARDRQFEEPVLGAPIAHQRGVMVEEALEEPGFPGTVGPRHPERHLLGWMNPGLRNRRQHYQLLSSRQPQLQPLRPQPEPVERRALYCRTVT